MNSKTFWNMHARRCFEDIIKPTQQILQALSGFFSEGKTHTALSEDPTKQRSVTWVRRYQSFACSGLIVFDFRSFAFMLTN